MMKSIIPTILPHFSGVHRGNGRTRENINFEYRGQPYYTSGQDTVDLRRIMREEEAQRDKINSWLGLTSRPFIGPATWDLERKYAELAQKEPNNGFQRTLSHHDVSGVLELLANPEVKLSKDDTPSSINLPERLLGNTDNFEYFSKELGGNEEAIFFIEKLLTEGFKSDLNRGFKNKNWGNQLVHKRNHAIPRDSAQERDEADISELALTLARDAVEAYSRK